MSIDRHSCDSGGGTVRPAPVCMENGGRLADDARSPGVVLQTARVRTNYDGEKTALFERNDDGNVESLLEDICQANEAFSGQRRGQTDQCLDER